tara:strand:- start:170 stop:514 length:345 start_codon:yes stop_codon:yes gene_type:complete
MLKKIILFSFAVLFYNCSSDGTEVSKKASFDSSAFKKAKSSDFNSGYGGSVVINESKSNNNTRANYSSYGNYSPTKKNKSKKSENTSSKSQNSSKVNYASEARKNATYSAYSNY